MDQWNKLMACNELMIAKGGTKVCSKYYRNFCIGSIATENKFLYIEVE